MFNCCQLFRSFEKNADRFMLGKKSEARKSLIKASIFSTVRYLKEEADEILPNNLDQKKADGKAE